MRKFLVIVLVTATLLFALSRLFGSPTYTWTEPLYTGHKPRGLAYRKLTFTSGAPELQAMEIRLGGRHAPLMWKGTTEITPRAIVAVDDEVYLVATPWLARGRPSVDSTCAYLFQYHAASAAWQALPSSFALTDAELMPLSSPTTFLRFGFPSRLSLSSALRPNLTPSGQIAFHSFDQATAPSLQTINNNRCR